MKMKNVHIVPLSNYTISLLEELKRLTSEYQYIFPTTQNKKHPFHECKYNKLCNQACGLQRQTSWSWF
jgi:integrase